MGLDNRTIVAVFVFCVALMPQPRLQAETFTTADVIARSGNTECLDWCITGICFWLVCSPFPPRCWIETTPKISHNLPDLVAVAYDHPGETPWTEFRQSTGKAAPTILDALLGVDEAQGGRIWGVGVNERETKAVRFKEAQVIGNPAAVLHNVFGVPFLCKSKVTPMLPYLQSELDGLAWRHGFPDSLFPEALVPGMREIGNWPVNSWGPVYPRSGFVTQYEDPKAGAVAAQRAMDVVTRAGQPHVYVPYGYNGHRRMQWGKPGMDYKTCKAEGGQWECPADYHKPCAADAKGRPPPGRCVPRFSVQWMPGANEKTDKWQMISPVQSRSCEAFGAAGDWADGKTADDGNYAWIYWRPYKCCMPGPGMFLTSIEFGGICP